MKSLDFWPIFGLTCAKFVEIGQKMPKNKFVSYQRLSLIGYISVSVNFGEYSVFSKYKLAAKVTEFVHLSSLWSGSQANFFLTVSKLPEFLFQLPEVNEISLGRLQVNIASFSASASQA